MSAFSFKGISVKVIGAFLAVAFALCSFLPRTVRATPAEENYRDALSASLRYLADGGAPAFGPVGGGWTVFALARGGYFPAGSDYFEEYYSCIEQTVAATASAVLNDVKSTENSRVVIALTSTGRDPRSVAGYDLTEPLRDFDYVKKQGISGVIFALLALDSCGADDSGEIRAKCVDYLLKRELNTGGWTLGVGAADPDITSMVIYALAGYGAADSAVSRGVDTLSGMQLDNGGYMSMGSANSESCAQVITALSSIGIDAATDERFIKNGNSLLKAFLDYRAGDGFAHISGAGVSRMATEQGAYALVAYNRYKTGRPRLYDMSDVAGITDPQPVPTPNVTPTPAPKATPDVTAPASTFTEHESAEPVELMPTISATPFEPINSPRVINNRTGNGIGADQTPDETLPPDNVQINDNEEPTAVDESHGVGKLILWIGAAGGAVGAVMCLLTAYKKHSKDIKKK